MVGTMDRFVQGRVRGWEFAEGGIRGVFLSEFLSRLLMGRERSGRQSGRGRCVRGISFRATRAACRLPSAESNERLSPLANGLQVFGQSLERLVYAPLAIRMERPAEYVAQGAEGPGFW